MTDRTAVGIVGAGPAGLLLSHLLARAGIESVVLEMHSRQYVENRVRAGVLEQGTVDLLTAVGLGRRLSAEGLIHEGIEIRFAGRRHRIDFPLLTGGRRIAVYGQHELVKDMIAARIADGGAILFEVADVALRDLDAEHPAISFRQGGDSRTLACDFVAGCDGFHGVCRQSIPSGAFVAYERSYPFAWVGILSQSRPPTAEVTYILHDRGFALLSMRSPEMARLYLQCSPDDDLAAWPDGRIWEELRARAALVDGDAVIEEGLVVQKGITPMRSFVVEPMRFARLFLAGDAAHIVPPTGAKGMNLAIADVSCLAAALVAFYRTGDAGPLAGYSQQCLKRVWQVQRFSWWMTNLLHRHPDETPFDQRRQLAELEYVTSSEAGMRTLAENYVGLPLAPGSLN
jgi:p-hydroxybenzoate 3-monooxygenase